MLFLQGGGMLLQTRDSQASYLRLVGADGKVKESVKLDSFTSGHLLHYVP